MRRWEGINILMIFWELITIFKNLIVDFTALEKFHAKGSEPKTHGEKSE